MPRLLITNCGGDSKHRCTETIDMKYFAQSDPETIGYCAKYVESRVGLIDSPYLQKESREWTAELAGSEVGNNLDLVPTLEYANCMPFCSTR